MMNDIMLHTQVTSKQKSLDILMLIGGPPNMGELFITSLMLGIGLAMDAFAVSICKGLSTRVLKVKHALICGGWFGFFQGLMPLIGFVLGVSFQSKIEAIDHWIAFVLFIGRCCLCGKRWKAAFWITGLWTSDKGER